MAYAHAEHLAEHAKVCLTTQSPLNILHAHHLPLPFPCEYPQALEAELATYRAALQGQNELSSDAQQVEDGSSTGGPLLACAGLSTTSSVNSDAGHGGTAPSETRPLPVATQLPALVLRAGGDAKSGIADTPSSPLMSSLQLQQTQVQAHTTVPGPLLLPTAMCDANAIHEERYANHACDAALSGAPAHSIAAASTYHLPLSSSTSTPLPPMLPFQLVDQQADISTTGLPAFLPMDVWPHGLPPSRSNGREPPAAEVTQPPSLSDAQAQASATSASSRVPSSRSASLLPTAEPVPPQTPASSLTAPPPPRRKLPTTDSVEQHRPAEATSGEHGVDRARQVQVPREVDASYVLLLSELAAPHAAAVTAKAAAFASSFVHTSPPAGEPATSHRSAFSP